MADYTKMVHKLEEAITCLKAAEEALLPTNEMTKMDSFVLAHFRLGRLTLNEAVTAIKNTSRYKRRAKQEPEE